MSAVAAELILSLAGKLISKWSSNSSIDQGLIPDKDGLVRGIKHLISFGDLVIPDSEKTKKTANDLVIDLALNAIRKFQREISPNLSEDGFLGNQTLNAILAMIRCADGAVGEIAKQGQAGIANFSASTELRPRVEIWVYIDADKLPRVTDHSNQVRDTATNVFEMQMAAMEWSKFCNIRFQFPDKSQKEKAHVWVIGEQLAESSTLALADLWPRNGILASKLLLRFNTKRSFVSSPEHGAPVFFGTALHEFGHILGLSHTHSDGRTSAVGELMHPAHQPQLIELSDTDKSRIQKIWGKPS